MPYHRCPAGTPCPARRQMCRLWVLCGRPGPCTKNIAQVGTYRQQAERHFTRRATLAGSLSLSACFHLLAVGADQHSGSVCEDPNTALVLDSWGGGSQRPASREFLGGRRESPGWRVAGDIWTEGPPASDDPLLVPFWGLEFGPVATLVIFLSSVILSRAAVLAECFLRTGI